MRRIPESELIINPDGSIFHLHIKPGEIAENIILVGDPERVELIVSFFDRVESQSQNREFVSKTGFFEGKHITVLSTGIGTDNIDIVLTELDALVNVDFLTRTEKDQKTALNIIRIGTSGALHKSIGVDSYLLSKAFIGFDGLLNFYQGVEHVTDFDFEKAFMNYMTWSPRLATPYFVQASEKLFQKLQSDETKVGITISSPGFYGPQGREVRLSIIDVDMNEKLANFEYKGNIITNYEMEGSAIAGLSKLLGHEAITVCAIIANRVSKTYSDDYKKTIKNLVIYVLKRI